MLDTPRDPGRNPADAHGEFKLGIALIGPDDAVRLTVNSFLAGGGDNFSVLLEGRDRRTGAMDVDALEAHVAAGVTPDDAPRIVRRN